MHYTLIQDKRTLYIIRTWFTRTHPIKADVSVCNQNLVHTHTHPIKANVSVCNQNLVYTHTSYKGRLYVIRTWFTRTDPIKADVVCM